MDIHGYGLFAEENIAEGSSVFKYEGVSFSVTHKNVVSIKYTSIEIKDDYTFKTA